MRAKLRIKTIQDKIRYIETIIEEHEYKIFHALQDEVKAKPALLMHLVSIAEQIKKLKDENEFEILEQFSKEDLKGLSDVRNFISHDYEGVDMSIIESSLRYGIQDLKKVVDKILQEHSTP